MPGWKDYERFLKHDGWEYLPQNSGTDKAYRKILSDGSVLRTRVSKSSKEIGQGLFASILKNQALASKTYYSKVLANASASSDDPEKRK